jgi:hypothetical protein
MKTLSTLTLIILSVIVSNTVFAANPCEKAKHCRQLSTKEALSLPWEPGNRTYTLTANVPMEFEATYHCRNCTTYSKLLGERCYQRTQGIEGNNEISGFILRNESKVPASLKLLLKETFIFEKDGRNDFQLMLKKEIINGQTPIGINYKFKLVEKLKSYCYLDDKGGFSSLDFEYNADPSLGQKGIQEAIGADTVKLFALGSSTTGFSALVNKIKRESIKTGPEFSYYAPGYQTEPKGNLKLSKINRSWAASGQVYDGKTMGSLFKDESLKFLSPTVTKGNEIEFWLSATTQEMYLVFPGEEDHPVIFPLSNDRKAFSRDGEAVFHEDKVVTAFVVLGHLEQLKHQMRPSTYRRTYGILEDSINETKKLLTESSNANGPMTEAMASVRNQMHTTFYTQKVLLRQRIVMDTKDGMKRENNVSKMMQQLDHMLGDYGFDDVRSGAPLYAIYGGYIADTINEMRIPDLMTKVPLSLKNIDDSLRKAFKFADALRVRESLSDANLKSGKIVDELIEFYEKELSPALQKTISAGMEWNGYEIRLAEYIESVRGIREIDINNPNSSVGTNGPIPENDVISVSKRPGKMPVPKKQ